MSMSPRILSRRDLYLFDTQGFLHVPQVLTAAEVSELRGLLEDMPSFLQEFSHARRWNNVANLHPRFAALARDARLVDHAFDVINQPMRLIDTYALRYEPGGSLFMHSGNVQDTVYPDGTHSTLNLAYRSSYHDGKLYTTQVKALVYLSTVESEDQGAFCYLHGSHKANFAFPWGEAGLAPGERLCDSAFPGVGRVLHKAGDVIFLNEALAHGAMRTTVKRSFLSFLYAPAFMADFVRIHPERDDIATLGYYDADYEAEAAGANFPVNCEACTGPNHHDRPAANVPHHPAAAGAARGTSVL